MDIDGTRPELKAVYMYGHENCTTDSKPSPQLVRSELSKNWRAADYLDTLMERGRNGDALSRRI